MNKNFSLDDFKKWMSSDQNENKKSPFSKSSEFIGEAVVSKIGYNKLVRKAESKKGELEDVCQEFVDDGGRVIQVKENKVLVEVSSGSFYIHRIFVEID